MFFSEQNLLLFALCYSIVAEDFILCAFPTQNYIFIQERQIKSAHEFGEELFYTTVRPSKAV